eukprot:1460850-Rhodomonas_salina.2
MVQPGSAAAQLVLDGIIAAGTGDRPNDFVEFRIDRRKLKIYFGRDEAVDMLRGRPVLRSPYALATASPETTVQITIHRRGNVHYNAGMMQQWPARRPQQRAADRNGHVTFSSKPSAVPSAMVLCPRYAMTGTEMVYGAIYQVWVDPDEEHRKSQRVCPTPILVLRIRCTKSFFILTKPVWLRNWT